MGDFIERPIYIRYSCSLDSGHQTCASQRGTMEWSLRGKRLVYWRSSQISQSFRSVRRNPWMFSTATVSPVFGSVPIRIRAWLSFPAKRSRCKRWASPSANGWFPSGFTEQRISTCSRSARARSGLSVRTITSVRFTDVSCHGLISAYHAHHREAQGAETRPTYYFYRHQDKPFHIDYVFVPKAWKLRSVEVGSFREWGQNRWSDSISGCR